MEILDEKKDVLQEMINTGIGKAAVSFSDMLNKEIKLSVPTLLFFSLNELDAYLGKMQNNEYVNVIQSFSGDMSGRGIVSFPLIGGKTIISTLMEYPDSCEPDFGSMERELIAEVGNVIINAVGSSMCNMAEIETFYQMPEIEFSNQIIETDNESDENIYCVGEGAFAVEGIDIEGKILFIITYSEIEAIINKLLYGE
jgi:chemotaxis protein CheC